MDGRPQGERPPATYDDPTRALGRGIPRASQAVAQLGATHRGTREIHARDTGARELIDSRPRYRQGLLERPPAPRGTRVEHHGSDNDDREPDSHDHAARHHQRDNDLDRGHAGHPKSTSTSR